MPSSNPSLPSSPPPSSPSPNRWGPYSSSKDFDANIATILIVVVGASAFSFALHAAITSLLRCYRRRRAGNHAEDNTTDEDPKEASPPPPHFAEAFPTLVFTSGTGNKVGGGEGGECAICLADFVDGERVTVLPLCNHGFHVHCVQKWLSAKPSCPTCRRSCRSEDP